jgi:hypothetical protein
MDDLPSIDQDVASIRLSESENAFSHFRPSGPDQTRHPKDLTTAQFKTHIVKLAFAGEALNPQGGLAIFRTTRAGSQIGFAELPPRHVTNHLVFIRPARVKLRDVRAVAEHRNAVPVLKDFIQAVFS